MMQNQFTHCFKVQQWTVLANLTNEEHDEENQDYDQSNVEFEKQAFHGKKTN